MRTRGRSPWSEGEARDQGEVVLDEQVSRNADGLFQQVLLRAIEARCSDIHLETLSIGLHVRFRIDGVLREPDFGVTQDALDRNAREIVSRVKILGRLDIAERRRPQDGSFRVTVDRRTGRRSASSRRRTRSNTSTRSSASPRSTRTSATRSRGTSARSCATIRK